MKLFNKLKNYHFEIRHLIILFAVLVIFQTVLSYINTTSTSNLLSRTMELYRRDSAENMADLITTSLEMLLENSLQNISRNEISKRGTVRELNIILSQQTLQQNVSEICILVPSDGRVYVIEDGEALYSYFFDKKLPDILEKNAHRAAVGVYSREATALYRDEQIYSELDENYAFHVLVPFVLQGELVGAVYMQIAPDFSKIHREISTSYDETGAIFSALILISLLVMFYISSYMLKERDIAQKQLFEERKIQFRREIEHQKEALFTQRIYHAHHKAEKVMGFIKTDLRSIPDYHAVIDRIAKYANFVSRVIYDMKSYEPPIEVIRNPLFRTDINEVTTFIIDHIFLRVFKPGKGTAFKLDLDPNLPVVPINEYVIWEIIEPLIQNSIDHNSDRQVTVFIRTSFDPQQNVSTIIIEDDGRGIAEDLLQTGDNGVKRIFLEHSSTKSKSDNSGYGCYLAYEISKKRCGWTLNAENREEGGARFIIVVGHGDG
ncbi:histidine kinase [candidate division KSB1 bacterium]|nr:histidine kinase [candidate division KSB1 bacterium]